MLSYEIQYCPQVFDVFLLRLREDEDVIEIHRGEWQTTKDPVHNRLKGGWGVCEPERQHFEFEVSHRRVKSRFGDIFLCHANLVIPLREIK